MCINDEIVQTSFAADYSSGDNTCFGANNPILKACDPMGKPLAEVDTCTIFKAYLKGLGKNAQGVPLVSDSTNYTLNGRVFNADNGLMDTYAQCQYDNNCVLDSSSVGCKTTCCINAATCAVNGTLCSKYPKIILSN